MINVITNPTYTVNAVTATTIVIAATTTTTNIISNAIVTFNTTPITYIINTSTTTITTKKNTNISRESTTTATVYVLIFLVIFPAAGKPRHRNHYIYSRYSILLLHLQPRLNGPLLQRT